MSRIVETTVYTFDELSDAAKEKARDWFRALVFTDSNDWGTVLDDAVNIAAMFGLTIPPRNQKYHVIAGHGQPARDGVDTSPSIYFSGFSSQGDGACFEGTYVYKADGLAEVSAHVQTGDAKLIEFVERHHNAHAPVFGVIGFTIKQAGHYNHSGCMDFTLADIDESYDDALAKLEPNAVVKAERECISALRSFADWIYRRLEEEHDYQMSKEAVDENITANEYEFTEDGERA